MSGIARRTVYIDPDSKRVWDFAKAVTAIGCMAEPFTPGLNYVAGGVDQTAIAVDEINRIDEVREASIGNMSRILGSEGDRALMGGNLTAKTGR